MYIFPKLGVKPTSAKAPFIYNSNLEPVLFTNICADDVVAKFDDIDTVSAPVDCFAKSFFDAILYVISNGY